MTQVSLAQFPNGQLPSEFPAFLAAWQSLLGTQEQPLATKEFAVAIGVPAPTLRDYMLGNSHPRKSRVVELEQKIGFPLVQFHERPAKRASTVTGRVAMPASGPVRMAPKPYLGTGLVLEVPKGPDETLQKGNDCMFCEAEAKAKVKAPVKKGPEATSTAGAPDVGPEAKIDNIIARRRALGLNGSQFAAYAGLHKGAWRRIELGQPHPKRRHFIRVALTKLEKLEAQTGKAKSVVALKPDGRQYASQAMLEKFANHLGGLLITSEHMHNVLTFNYREFYNHLKAVTGADTCDPTALSEVLKDRTLNGRGSYLMMAGNNVVIIAKDENFAPVV